MLVEEDGLHRDPEHELHMENDGISMDGRRVIKQSPQVLDTDDPFGLNALILGDKLNPYRLDVEGEEFSHLQGFTHIESFRLNFVGPINDVVDSEKALQVNSDQEVIRNGGVVNAVATVTDGDFHVGSDDIYPLFGNIRLQNTDVDPPMLDLTSMRWPVNTKAKIGTFELNSNFQNTPADRVGVGGFDSFWGNFIKFQLKMELHHKSFIVLDKRFHSIGRLHFFFPLFLVPTLQI
ncbi:hypothetical protein L2E82_15750 [Cichorium intybus]|uniref:Uncharacterized protein n=1 Tax=Cichorium intybus TaxID=13427 RepID=A0ACB9F4K7_CICIN|nr:hypothetical protein L2E82_15750 [Cichorium intybus]